MIGYIYIENTPVAVDSAFVVFGKQDRDRPNCVITLSEDVDMYELGRIIGDGPYSIINDIIIYKDTLKEEIVWQKHGFFKLANITEHVSSTDNPEHPVVIIKELNFIEMTQEEMAAEYAN